MKTKLNRIEVGGLGFGEASDVDIERRAGELARADGRIEINDADIAQARSELGGRAAVDLSEEIAEADRPGNGFPAGGEGTRAAKFEMDDEANLAEELVEEGVNEADHNSRVHSNDDRLAE